MNAIKLNSSSINKNNIIIYRMMNLRDNHLSLAKLQLDAVIKANIHKGVALTGRLAIFVSIILVSFYKKL